MKSQRSLSLLLILSTLLAFTSLSTDVYLPAMPLMEQTLGGSAELTITGFLIGFAIAQLIWGPISDRVGRKIPLFIGVFLFIASTIGCAMSETMNEVVFWRVLQAIGACVGPMLSRTMVRDLYNRSQAAQMLSTLTIIMAVVPLAGPFIGAALLKISSWHTIFWFLAAVGILVFASLFKLPETLPPEKRSGGSLLNSFKNYRTLLGNRKFMLYTLSVTFFYVAAYAFITGSPFVYIEHFGVAEQHYGFLFGINVIGIVAISFANRRLVSHFKLTSMLTVASSIATLAGLLLVIAVFSEIGGIYAIIATVFVIFSTNGIIAACSNAIALDSVPDQMAGSAAAMLGSLQYGSGIVSSLLLAYFSNSSPVPMAMIMAVFVGLGLLMAVWGGKLK